MAFQFRDPASPLTDKQCQIRELVLNQIITAPDTFDMANWECHDDGYRGGTTRCIAGWANYFAYGNAWGPIRPEPFETLSSTPAYAIKALGLTEDEYLPHSKSWPLFHAHDEDATERMHTLVHEPDERPEC